MMIAVLLAFACEDEPRTSTLDLAPMSRETVIERSASIPRATLRARLGLEPESRH
jgi:hypothetical protein